MLKLFCFSCHFGGLPLGWDEYFPNIGSMVTVFPFAVFLLNEMK